LPAAVALLRGVNLAGANRVSMADLRGVFEGLGLADVRTVLQSGNVVFEASDRGAAALETAAEQALAGRLGLRTEVFVRTAHEWAAMIADNPFADAARQDPAHLVAMVLKAAPPATAPAALAGAIVGRERVKIVGRAAFIVYPDGIGDSRFTGARLDRALGVRGTGRNWNTVLKLARMAGVA
jgi:uncharacterized protein (DUF1697 family)